MAQWMKDRSRAVIEVSLVAEGIALDGSGSTASAGSGAAVVSHAWRPRRGNPTPLRLASAAEGWSQKRIVLRPPRVDGEYYVHLKVADAEGRADTAAAYFVVENGEAGLVEWQRENARWVEEAVVYGVVPRNFGPHGFQSVVERLDYLADLGITALWLSPCNTTPTTTHGHGYGITDYFRLRRDYGTKPDFRRLVREAHARGIRVLMDFVPNHTSIEHPYLKDAQARGRASPYYDYYHRGEDGEPTHYFHWRNLPNLNYDNPEVRRWMMEAFCYWVRDYDVDGFRMDSAWGIKQRRPEFWRECCRELKRIKPDVLLLAEASARDPYWFTEGFDAAYDWTNELGHWAWEGVFERAEGMVKRLHQALTNGGRGFHEDALAFRFLNNNDTGPRFISRYGLGTEMVAAAMLLTLPGLPCIYTGQEVGEEFEPYRTPGPISWQDRRGLREYYRKLIWLRRRLPCLHSRRWEILEVSGSEQAYAYARYAERGEAPALVVLNFSPQEARVEIGLTEQSQSFGQARELADLLRDERVRVETCGGASIRLRVPGFSARILAEAEGEGVIG